MPRKSVPLQVNQFTGGFNTQLNPLNMPVEVSVEEENMEITLKGSRLKRLGFDFEDGYEEIDTLVDHQPSLNLGKNVFRWENAGNIPDKYILVVQVSGHISFYNFDSETSVTGDIIHQEVIPNVGYDASASFAVVDGLLVCALGTKEVYIFEYENEVISKSTKSLLIRDLFGVQAKVNGVDLTRKDNYAIRPTSVNSEHLYNLRNQTFFSAYRNANEETPVDPILAFYSNEDGAENPFSNFSSVKGFLGFSEEVDEDGNPYVYPSNSDNLNLYLYADPNDGNNRIIERFFPKNMKEATPQVGEAPKGYFIIDALDRGRSRIEKERQLREQNDKLSLAVSTLPQDKTPGGATVVSEFAGRVWYSGFSGEVINGDERSPRMSSYVLFSSLVSDVSDINQCYQRANPTSPKDADLAATDGGFIRLSGAYGVSSMVAVANSLFVFAANGIWRVSGDSDSNFTATSYQTEKISNFGVISPNSVVLNNTNIFYWSEDGIMVISRNEYGAWIVSNISEKTIQNFYTSIPEDKKRSVSGIEDVYEKKIRWVYASSRGGDTKSEELVLDLNYSSFTYNTIPSKLDGLPLVTNVVKTQPYKLQPGIEYITTNEGVVITTESSQEIYKGINTRVTSTKESLYLVITQFSPTIKYSLGTYKDVSNYDWTDVGYEAFIVTGSLTGGEARLRKQVPYLHTFFKKTESGFDEDFNAINSSSCLVSAQWNWTSNERANKWSNKRQAYRPKAIYAPLDSDDNFDNGYTVIETRNKIRGAGHSVSFRFESEYGKTLHIHGWSFTAQANKNE